VHKRKAYSFFISQFAECLEQNCGEIVKEGFLRYAENHEKSKSINSTDLVVEDMEGATGFIT
jgi:hypothetical protein